MQTQRVRGGGCGTTTACEVLSFIAVLGVLIQVVSIRFIARAAGDAEQTNAESESLDQLVPFRPIRLVPAQPAIVDVPVTAARDINGRVTDKELVFGVVVNGEARAYPINMLTGPKREILNDTLGKQAIAATW